MPEKTCKNCRWYVPSNSYYKGACHRNPPTILMAANLRGDINISKSSDSGYSGSIHLEDKSTSQGYSCGGNAETGWPMVDEGDFCGEWKTKNPNGLERAIEKEKLNDK